MTTVAATLRPTNRVGSPEGSKLRPNTPGVSGSSGDDSGMAMQPGTLSTALGMLHQTASWPDMQLALKHFQPWHGKPVTLPSAGSSAALVPGLHHQHQQELQAASFVDSCLLADDDDEPAAGTAEQQELQHHQNLISMMEQHASASGLDHHQHQQEQQHHQQRQRQQEEEGKGASMNRSGSEGGECSDGPSSTTLLPPPAASLPTMAAVAKGPQPGMVSPAAALFDGMVRQPSVQGGMDTIVHGPASPTGMIQLVDLHQVSGQPDLAGAQRSRTAEPCFLLHIRSLPPRPGLLPAAPNCLNAHPVPPCTAGRCVARSAARWRRQQRHQLAGCEQ
jgi:hypothetical protein